MLPLNERKLLLDEFFSSGIQNILPSRKFFENMVLSNEQKYFYIGADPTRPDLHIGHAVVLWKMRILQQMGHKIIFLIGDFTARIGDPTGKSDVRNQMTEKEILKNAETYKTQITKIFDFEGRNPAEIRFNSTWLSSLNFEDILRLSAKFTTAQMLERDMFADRLKAKKPIFLHEFFYPLMQGYDSVAMEVDGEFGGSDQLFNMMVGRTLEKAYLDKEKAVIITDLLVGNDGRKMSKSYDNYIALTDSPKKMYGKVMSVKDELMEEYFSLATRVSKGDRQQIIASLKAGENPRNIKMRLAREIVKLYSSEDDAKEAERAFIEQFQKGGLPTDVDVYSVEKSPIRIIDLIVLSGLSDSNSNAKRHLKAGAVKIDGIKVSSDPSQEIQLDKDFILSVGKLNHKKISLKISKKTV